MKTKDILWMVVFFGIIFGLYVLASFIVKQNVNPAIILRHNYALTISIFFILAVIDVVGITIPVLVPFMPVFASAYGSLLTGIIASLGWTTGGILAFFIAKKYGCWVITRLLSKKRITDLSKLIPKKHLFWFVVFARIFLPLDVVSYYLGIFTSIKFRTYLLAYLVGVVPVAFFLAYVGSLTIFQETVIFVMAIGAIVIVRFIYENIIKKFIIE